MTFEELQKANSEIAKIDIKGKAYAQVTDRVLAFRKLFPNGSINTEIVEMSDGVVTIKAYVRDENGALGYAQGWNRRADGHWYDEYGNQIYDRGGVLHGKGGIKATNKPEIILDPELTTKILRPGSEAQFRAFADAMHLMFERGGRTRAEMPVIRNPSVTDSHNTSYTVNGIPISSGSAERYTIAELFRMLPMARS